MSKLEDIHTLVRLLKEYEFPVSPILEYAINEKIELLSSNDKGLIVTPTIEVQDRKDEMSVKPIIRSKKGPSVLRIVRADGTKIECEKAANSFCSAIREIGVEKIFSLKIPMDGMYLINKGGNPKYPTAQHDVGYGYFVNVHSNTVTKKRQLERIFKAFNLNWLVEIIES